MNIWQRISDRSKDPRRWWYPLPASNQPWENAKEWQRQHDDVSQTIRRTMLALIAYCFFCGLTLAAPDESLLSNQATIDVPFADVAVSFTGFLFVGPIVLIGLTVYLHVFIGHLLKLGPGSELTELPYLFNLRSKLASSTAYIIFYWLTPFTLIGFAWKGEWRPEGAAMLILAITITIGMILIQLRRFVESSAWVRTALWIIVIATPALGIAIDRAPQLSNAELENVDLSGWDLSYANLEEADLQGANLREAILQGANLQGANLRGARYLTQAQLDLACGNEATMLSPGLSISVC